MECSTLVVGRLLLVRGAKVGSACIHALVSIYHRQQPESRGKSIVGGRRTPPAYSISLTYIILQVDHFRQQSTRFPHVNTTCYHGVPPRSISWAQILAACPLASQASRAGLGSSSASLSSVAHQHQKYTYGLPQSSNIAQPSLLPCPSLYS